ncbi:MAG TPA: stage II sporulation protein P [Clostridia bacterium]|nr:stage II sporulation protein P [Clostridia bacterium]
MVRNKSALVFLIIFGLIVLGSATYANHHSVLTSGWWNFLGVSYESEAPEGKYYQIVDQSNNTITMTALPVHVDDEFWAADNKHYRVTKVKDFTAYCEYLGTENIAWLDEWDDLPAAADISVQGGNKQNNVVGVYHTHTDESYTPTDGAASHQGRGGILKVGTVFAEKMKSLGLEVYHDKTPHDPHDAGAYQRSRRTAVNLLKKQPAIVFDVHRDAVPAEVYESEVKGQKVTKIKMVVGRQNQNKQANLEFAKTMKAAMDKTHPGLFEGIFLARGNYNQDLGPRMMLVEVGSDKNSREDAQRGAALFADTVPKVLGVYQSRANNPQYNQMAAPDITRSKSGSGQAIWWLLGILVVGGGLFLLISTGSVSGGMKKLKEFAGSEWKNAFSKRKEK